MIIMSFQIIMKPLIQHGNSFHVFFFHNSNFYFHIFYASLLFPQFVPSRRNIIGKRTPPARAPPEEPGRKPNGDGQKEKQERYGSYRNQKPQERMPIRHGAPFQIPAQDNQLNGQHHGA